jgi:hypothetical protein
VYSLAYTLITHASQHNPDGSHKTVQIQGTTCRWAGGALVEKRETFNAQRSTPNIHCLGAGGEGHVTSDLWLAAAGMRPRPDCTRLGATCPHYRQSGGRCKLSRRLCRAPVERLRLSSGFAEVGLGAEDLPLLKGYRGFIDGQIHSLELFLGSKPPVGDEKYRSTVVFYHSIGNFHYLTGMNDVWLRTRRYDLRAHKKARLLLVCLAEANAVDEKSALHFLNEIDPYVREKGQIGPLGKFSETKIQDYFREPTGELASLGQGVIRAVGGNGKYYLNADGV